MSCSDMCIHKFSRLLALHEKYFTIGIGKYFRRFLTREGEFSWRFRDALMPFLKKPTVRILSTVSLCRRPTNSH